MAFDGDYLLDLDGLSLSPTDQGQIPQQECGGSAATNVFFQGSSTLGFSSYPAAFGTLPCPEQQLYQAAGSDGCLAGPSMNQWQGNQSAAATQPFIAQQYSGRSPAVYTGDPCSQRNIPTDQGQNPQQEFGGSAGTNGLFQSSLTLGFSAPSMINQGSPAAFGTQPCPEQQLGQAAGPNGCLAGRSINQWQPNKAAGATQSLIAQEHSGQIRAADSLEKNGKHYKTPAKKRQYDQNYRENKKKQRQELVIENGKLKEEKQQMNSKLEASEKQRQELVVENGKLKEEKQQMNSKLEASEKEKLELVVENGKLKEEKQQMNSKLEASEKQRQEIVVENGKLKEEKQQMNSKLEASEKERQELVVENGKLKDKKQQMEYEPEASEAEIQVKEQQMKSNLEPKLQIEWLRDEVDSLKKDNACVNQRMQTQSRELALLQNRFNKFELKQQNGALPQSLTTQRKNRKRRRMMYNGYSAVGLIGWSLPSDSDSRIINDKLWAQAKACLISFLSSL